MRTICLLASALAVLFFAPWNEGPWTFIAFGVLFGALLILTVASHVVDVVPVDSDEMDRRS
jgi:hypothetical protein